MTGTPADPTALVAPDVAVEASLAAAAADVARARAEIEALSRLTETQTEQIAAVTRAAVLAEARVDDLVRAAADRHVLRASVQALERRLADLRQRQSGRDTVLAAQILADGAVLAALEAERDRLGARVERLERELATLHAHVDAMRRDHARLYASTSWKVTAPLRALRRLLTRL